MGRITLNTLLTCEQQRVISDNQQTLIGILRDADTPEETTLVNDMILQLEGLRDMCPWDAVGVLMAIEGNVQELQHLLSNEQVINLESLTDNLVTLIETETAE